MQVVLVQVAVEDRAVLGALDLEAGPLAHLGQRLLRVAQFVALAFDGACSNPALRVK